MSKSFSSRLIGSLKNENVMAVSSAHGLTAVKLADSKTGKVFAYCTESPNSYTFVTADAVMEYATWDYFIRDIKALPTYPAPKVREPKMVAKTHGAPKYVGLSMGSFKPEVALFNTEK